MSNIERVKKVLDEPVTCEDGNSHYIDENNKRHLSSQICQLWPKTEDNPDGIEPKADEGRLLTEEEIERQIRYVQEHNDLPLESTVTALCWSVAEAQRDLTASLKDAEFAKEKELMFNPDWKPDIQAMLKDCNDAIA